VLFSFLRSRASVPSESVPPSFAPAHFEPQSNLPELVASQVASKMEPLRDRDSPGDERDDGEDHDGARTLRPPVRRR
jgi:hypothetical protein